MQSATTDLFKSNDGVVTVFKLRIRLCAMQGLLETVLDLLRPVCQYVNTCCIDERNLLIESISYVQSKCGDVYSPHH